MSSTHLIMTTTAFAFGNPPAQGGQLSEREIKSSGNYLSIVMGP
jgi:hypothetical protein